MTTPVLGNRRAFLRLVAASSVSAFFTTAAPYAKSGQSRVVGMYGATPLVQWAVETGYNISGSPPGSNNLAGIEEYNNVTVHGFATIGDFVNAWTQTIEGPLYAAVREAKSIEAQLLALGQSPWAAGHYAADGIDGELLVEVYTENKALIDSLMGTEPTSDLAGGDALPTLKAGDTGDAVKVLQILLNRAGDHLTVDGDFGPAVLAAVNAVKRQAGLAQDGVAGVDVWRALVD